MSEDVVRAVRERFDARAASYDESAMHRGLAEAVAGFADLAGVTSVLDVATGTGLVLRALHERHQGLELTGVDISPGMLAVARAALPGARWAEADARALPARDASVDLVTCVTALHLVPGTAEVVAEWARVLRAGGRAVVATFAQFEAARHHRESPDGAAPYPMRHDAFRTPDAVAAAASPAGFALGRHARWTDGHDTLVLTELVRPGS